MPTRPTARARRSADHFDQCESAKRALCAMLFEDPSSVVDVLSHEVTGPLDVEPHTHADLLQLDLIAGCVGEAVVGEQRVAVRGTTLMIAHPGEPHGYTLGPGVPPSEVWLVKLRLPPAWRGRDRRPFPSVLTGLPPQAVLLEEVVAFASYWTKNAIGSAGLSHLARAIADWPTHAADLPVDRHDPVPAEGESALSRVRYAAYTLARRTAEPPSLEELADTAGLSPRHFARLFREAFGCTPHAYVASQRLDAARRLLLTPGVSASQAADQLGFTSVPAFSRWFTRLAGQSPTRFREDPSTF